MQDFINAKAPTLATTYNSSISSNVEITLNTGCTYIEVTAIGAGVFLKYGSTASSTTFDEFVGVGLTRTYVIPTGTTKVDFVQESATGKIVIIQK
jgi:hypothetical protein